MAGKKEDAMAKTGPSEIEAVPDFLKQFKGQQLGNEDTEKQDVTLPVIKICQDLSPYRKKSDPRFIPGLDSGQFFNNVTGRIYGTKIVVVNIKFGKGRMWCKPMNEGGGIICQSQNGKTGGRLHPDSCETCPHSQWNRSETEVKPECGLLHNHLCLVGATMEEIIEQTDAAVVSMKSTSLKISKGWNSLLRFGDLPRFAKAWELNVVDETKGGGTYGQFAQPKGLGYVSPEVFTAAKLLYESMKDKDIQVDMSDDDGDVDDGTSFDSKEL